jgi:hypothetical protein
MRFPASFSEIVRKKVDEAAHRIITDVAIFGTRINFLLKVRRPECGVARMGPPPVPGLQLHPEAVGSLPRQLAQKVVPPPELALGNLTW